MAEYKTEMDYLSQTEGDVSTIPTVMPNFRWGLKCWVSRWNFKVSHSVPDKHCTSGFQHSTTMNYGGGLRLTSGNVVIVTIGSGVVENVGLAVGISVISHSIPEVLCTSGLKSAILKHVVGWRRAMSGNVGRVTIDSGMVEYVRVAFGISTISHSVPEKNSTSGLLSAILNYGCPLTSVNVGSVTTG